jgi:hypothetical protein
MLVNLYKTKSPVAIFSLPLLIAILALPIFYRSPQEIVNAYTWQSILVGKVRVTPWLNYVLTFIIIVIGAMQLNNVVNNNGFYSKNTYLPGFIFTVFLISLNEFEFSFNLISYVMLIFALGYLFRVTRQESAKHVVFMASLFLGVAITFSPIFFLIGLLPWITLIIFRPFVWREYLLVIIGLGIPWLYHFGLVYFFSKKLSIQIEGLSLINEQIALTASMLILTAVTLIIMLFSLWNYLVIAAAQLLSFKKRSRILYHLVWISLVVGFLEWYFYDLILDMFILPFSIFISLHLLNARKPIIINTVILVWFCLAVMNYVFLI